MNLKDFIKGKKPSPYLKMHWAIKDIEYRAADDPRWSEVKKLVAKAMALSKSIELEK